LLHRACIAAQMDSARMQTQLMPASSQCSWNQLLKPSRFLLDRT